MTVAADWWAAEQFQDFSAWKKNRVSVLPKQRATHEADLSDAKPAEDLSNTEKAVCVADLTNPS